MDWLKLYHKFNELKKARKVTLLQFAESEGLNPNTVRKNFARLKAEFAVVNDPQNLEQPKARKPAPSTAKKAAPKAIKEVAGGKAQAKAPKSAGVKKPDRDHSAPVPDNVVSLDSGKKKPGKAKTTTNKMLPAPAVTNESGVITPKPKKYGLFSRIKPGQAEKYRKDAAKHFETCEQSSFERLYAHVTQLESVRDMMIDGYRLQSGIISGEIPPSHPDYYSLPPSLPDPDMQASSYLVGITPHIAECHRALFNMKQKAQQHHLMMQKANEERTKQNIIRSCFEMKEKEGWNSTQLAEFLAALGIDTPRVVLAQSLKEIEEGTHVPAQEGEAAGEELSQEELDLRALASAKRRRDAVDFVAERQKVVTSIVNEGGYGDVDLNGVMREGEGETVTDEEEFDDEVNRLLYQEDDFSVDEG